MVPPCRHSDRGTPFPEEYKIRLGNLESRRDWGYAEDYVRAMWLMLQADEPNDYVVATGETRTVLEFVQATFKAMGWNSDEEHVRDYIVVDPKFYRPSEVEYLLGDPTKAKEKLGWEPEFTFEDMVNIMVERDKCHT